MLYILALESEPREQFKTNQEGRSKPEEELGENIDHWMGNEKEVRVYC